MVKTLVNQKIANKGFFLKNLGNLCSQYNGRFSASTPLDLVSLNNLSPEEFVRWLDSLQLQCKDAQDIQLLITQLREAVTPILESNATSEDIKTEPVVERVFADEIYTSLKEAAVAANRLGRTVVPVKQGRTVFYKLEGKDKMP